jgi:flagellar export protein FliJ
MKKFRFQFDAVLKVRKGRENDALAALGAAQRTYQLELARKQELQDRLSGSLARREGLGSEATTVLAFQLEQAFINGTKQRIIQSDQAILRASRGVERALRAYLAARRQTRMIEMLEEKAFAEYRKEASRKERRDLDELMVMRARLAENAPHAIDPAREETA